MPSAETEDRCSPVSQQRQDFSRLCDDLTENVRTLTTPDVTNPCPITPQ